MTFPTERARLTKEIAAHAVDIDRTQRKLGNTEFVAKAPEEVVEENRARLAAAEGVKARLEVLVERLGAFEGAAFQQAVEADRERLMAEYQADPITRHRRHPAQTRLRRVRRQGTGKSGREEPPGSAQQRERTRQSEVVIGRLKKRNLDLG